jgi:hypothetical protein
VIEARSAAARFCNPPSSPNRSRSSQPAKKVVWAWKTAGNTSDVPRYAKPARSIAPHRMAK